MLMHFGGKTAKLPTKGHRDSRNISFFEEISLLAQEAHHVGDAKR